MRPKEKITTYVNPQTRELQTSITTVSSDDDTYTTINIPDTDKACSTTFVPSVLGAVDHPSHYNSGKIEVIDFIEDQKLGFHLGNAVKYICRAGKKDPSKVEEDLDKAIWYINRYMNQQIYKEENK